MLAWTTISSHERAQHREAEAFARPGAAERRGPCNCRAGPENSPATGRVDQSCRSSDCKPGADPNVDGRWKRIAGILRRRRSLDRLHDPRLSAAVIGGAFLSRHLENQSNNSCSDRTALSA